MKIIYKICILLACATLIPSCGNKECDHELEIVFKAKYGDNDLIMLSKQDYPNLTIRFLASTMFISDLNIVTDEGEQGLSDVEFLDFTMSNSTDEGAEQGIRFTFDNIEGKTIEEINFGVGVNPENNVNLPADYDSSSPLSNAGHHWIPWESYVFSKFEGKFDTDPDGTFDSSFLYHSGVDINYAPVNISVDKSLDCDKTTIILSLDHKALFEKDGSYFDVESDPVNHQPDQPGVILISDNMSTSWSVN